MSILQVVRSAEVAELAAKFRKAKHGVDRLRIILENQDLIKCERTKKAEEKPSCCNCGQSHTANYGRCPFAPKPRSLLRQNKPKAIDPTTRKVTVTPPETKTSAGGDGCRPVPIPSINPWSSLGEDITTIMSILQVVRNAEVSDLVAKFRKPKHGVDRLKV
ncbi:hypothetical protein EVAR_45365_1 [Eumeta japonica]|uniref:Nucleic-acid-binding protein from transposon X-element n=1 Tax=Eumeta variegata TaxID=151549 RepID=A0A4C1Y0M3_EUMVA|nr:hypothetical protein EVAR_45365_1 [Eumeta japonica]